MKIQPFLIVLTLVNMALFTFSLAQLRPAVAADEVAPVLRGRALQIVDDRGTVRASINVYPASTQPNGENYPERSHWTIEHQRDICTAGGAGHGQFVETEK